MKDKEKLEPSHDPHAETVRLLEGVGMLCQKLQLPERNQMTPDQPTATATPRTDAALIDLLQSNRFRVEHLAPFTATLERELSSAQAALAEGEVEVARLMADSEALDFAMAECNQLRAEVEHLRESEQAFCADRDQLRARVAELEQDKARLDWLEAIYGNVRISSVKGSFETLQHTWDTKRMRKHIDAAKGQP
jgi:hypothetical protein